jgi:hypothetical protein
MNREQEEAYEAAKLAAMVGGRMNLIDRMTTERSNAPANKINIHEFINKVKNPNAQIRTFQPSNPNNYAAIPEEIVMAQIPDAIPTYIPPTAEPIQGAIQPPLPVEAKSTLPADSVNLPHIVKPKQEVPKFEFREDVNPLLTRSDIDSIRNSLKNIDKSLSGMLQLLKISNIVTTHE